MRRIHVLLFMLQAAVLSAQTSTWTGGGGTSNQNFTNATNWQGGLVPSSGYYLIFNSANVSGGSYTANNNITPYNLPTSGDGILIQGGQAFTITGSPFVILAGGASINFSGSVSSTMNNNLDLSSGGLLTILSNPGPNTYSGAITGTGGVTIEGSLVLGKGNNANTYSGTTTVFNGGVLSAGAANALSANSAVTLNPAATLSLANLTNPSVGFSSTISTLASSDSTGMVKLASGTLTIANSAMTSMTFAGSISALSGGITLSAGTLDLTGNSGNFSSQANPATLTIPSGATLDVGSATAIGTAGAQYVNLKIGGNLNLMGNSVLANQLTGSGMIATGGGTLTTSATGTFSGTISGIGGLTVGAGALTLTTANTYTGATTIGTGGTLQLNVANAISSSTSLVFETGGSTLDVNVSGFSFSNPINLQPGAFGTFNVNANTVTIGGAISTTPAGVGNLSVTGTNMGILILGGANSYSGATTITDATVQLNNAAGLGNTSGVTLLGTGTLDLNGNSITIGNLAGSSDSNVEIGMGTLTLEGLNSSVAYYGVISGMGGSVTASGGTVTLLNTNTYTGATSLEGGTLFQILNLGDSTSLVFPAPNNTSMPVVPTGGGTIVFGSNTSFAHDIVISGTPVPVAQFNGTFLPNTYTVTFSGDIVGGSNGNLIFKGPGTTQFTAPGSMTSGVFSLGIQGGVLQLINATLGTGFSPPPQITFSLYGGTLRAGGALTIPSNQVITFGSGGPGLPSARGIFDTNGNTISIASPISGSGPFVLTDSSGGGKLTLTGVNNTWAGTTTILNGTLNAIPASIPGTNGTGTPTQLIFGGLEQPMGADPIFQIGASFPAFAPAIILMSSGTIDLNGNTMTASGVFTGNRTGATPVTLTLTDTNPPGGAPPYNTLTLSNTANLFPGIIEVDHATLVAGSTQAFGTALIAPTINLGTDGSLMLGTFSNTIGSLEGGGLGVNLGSGALTINNGNGHTFTGNITDGGSSGALLLTTGTLTLSGMSNTYHGPTTISSGGTLIAGSNTALSSNSLFVVNGTLSLVTFNNTIGGLSGSGAVNLGTATLTLASGHTFSGTMNGSTGGLTLAASSSSTQVLSGTSSYSGATTINALNTLQATSTTALSPTSAFTVNGTLNLTASNTVGSITGSGNISLVGSSVVLTIANGASNTFNGTIANSGGIALSAGTLTLGGSNSYSGPTTVSGGSTLIASNGNASPFGIGSAVTVASSSTLNFGTVAAAGVSVGSIANSGTVAANVAAITGSGITLASYTQSTTNSSLSLTLPATPDVSFAAINATGALAVNGTLTVTGLSAPTGQTIALLKGSSRTGTFANTHIPANYTLSYTSTGVFLQGGSPSGSFFWTGATNNLMSVNGNWQGGVAPVSGDILVFADANVTGSFAAENNIGAYTLSSTGTALTIESGFTISPMMMSDAFIVSGSGATINLAAGTNTTPSTISTPFTLNGTATIIGSANYIPSISGAITGTGGLTLTTGSIILSSSGGNTYSGTTTIDSGATLSAGAMNAFSTASAITLASGGTLNLANNSCSVLSLSGGDSTSAVNIGTGTLTITDAGASALGAAITAAAGGELVLGGGTLTLTGNSPGFSSVSAIASVTVDSGATLIGAAGSFGSAAGAYIDLAINGTLNLTGSANLIVNQLSGNGTFDIQGSNVVTTEATSTFSGNITGSGGLSVGGGVLTLTGSASNYTGTTTILAGTLNAIPTAIAGTAQLTFGGAGSGIFKLGNAFPAFTPALNMTSSGQIDLNGHNMTASGVLSGGAASTLTITNTGGGTPTLTLTGGSNSFPGTIQVDHATLIAGSAQAFGTASVAPTINLGTSGSLSLGSNSNTIGSLAGGGGGVNLGTGTLTINNGNGNTFTGNITDGSNGGLVLTAGTLTLTPGTANTYHGSTTIGSGGTLVAGSSSAFSNNSLFVVNGTLNLAGNNSTVEALSGTGGAVSLGTATLTIANGGGNAFVGRITGTGGLTLSTGTQILGGSAASAISYSGTTTISGGSTLQANNTSALSQNSTYSISGTLSLMGNSNTVRNITGSGGISLGSGGILTIANGAGTFLGTITNAGGGGITLSSGTLTLNSPNTYTGPTTVNGGTLIASNGNTSPFGVGSDITVGGAGTLNFGTVYMGGISIGSLKNSATVTADLSMVTADHGITLSDSLGYSQTGTPSLSLNLTATPSSSFIPIYSPSGPISLGIQKGTLNVTGLAPASGSPGQTVILMQGTSQSGTFATTSVPSGYTVKYNPGDGIVYLLGGMLPPMVCDATWNFPGSAVWDTVAHWTSCIPGITPGQILDAATLPDLSASNITITLATADGSSPQNISLYNLDFTAENTSYTILSYVSSLDPPTYSTITLEGNTSPKPHISVTAGSHSIYAPILLNKDSRISLSGTLTMGIFSSISGNSTLYISEGGFGTGTLISEGPIFPSAVNIEGTTVDNLSSMTPSTSLMVNGKGTNTAPLTLNNYSLIVSDSITIDGSAGTTLVNNVGPGSIFPGFGEIFTTSAGPLTINSTTVTNTLGGQISAGTGQTLTVTSSQLSNDSASILGSFTSNIDFISGYITTSGQVQAANYTQAGGATLQINVANHTTSGLLSIHGTGSLGGTLVVNAEPGFPSTPLNQAIPLVVDTSAFTSLFTTYSLQNFPHSVIPEIIIQPGQILLNTVPVTPSHTNAAGPQLLIFAISANNSLITRKCFQMNSRIPAPATKETEVAAGSLNEDKLYAQNMEIAQTVEIEHKLPELARKAAVKPTRPWNVYAGPIANFGHLDTIGPQIGLGHYSVGGFAGFDVVLPKSDEGSVASGIGAIAEYRHVWGTALENSGTLSLDRIHGSLYGTILPAQLPELFFEWILGTVYTWDTAVRFTGFENSVHATGKTNETVVDALAGVEFTFAKRMFPSMRNFSLTPLFHIQYAYDHIGSYKETGGGIYDLSVPSQDVQSLVSSLGARFDYLFEYQDGFNLVLEFDAEWKREYFTTNRQVPLVPFLLTSVPTETTVFGAPANGLLLALDAFATLPSGLNFEGNATFQWSSRAYDTSFFFQAGKEF